MMRKDILAEAFNALRHDDFFDLGAFAVYTLLTSGQREVLRQVMEAPTWDGNIASKSARDELIGMGLAVRCCFRGEQGYTAATYMAYSVMKVEKENGLWRSLHSAGARAKHMLDMEAGALACAPSTPQRVVSTVDTP